MKTTSILFLLAGLVLAYFLFSMYFNNTGNGDTQDAHFEPTSTIATEEPNENSHYTFLKDCRPTSTTGQIINHKHYSLSYYEKHEQAEWVAYELTAASLRIPNVKRSNDFRPDPAIRTGSASRWDYKGSGYDRGHMVPAADMAFSEEAMRQTFYMSNMSPQVRGFNQGIWRELEENVRDWAWKNKTLYVVSGVIFDNPTRRPIGKNKVTVPPYYYKALLDLKKPEQKGIAFIIPNEVQTKHLYDFATSIDELENRTGIDFFKALPNNQEAKLESTFDIKQWKVSDKRYQLRLNKWNIK